MEAVRWAGWVGLGAARWEMEGGQEAAERWENRDPNDVGAGVGRE